MLHIAKPKGEESLSTFVAPLLPKLDLPAIPPITDKALKNTVFTHVSSRVMPKRFGTSMFPTIGQAETDYEKLEHVGDALLGAVVTTMLQEIYPNFRQGSASITYHNLVCNRTLAQIAVQYGLPDLVRCHVTQRHVVKKKEKVRASIFEAYIAGLYYSILGSEVEDEDTPKASITNSQNLSPRSEAIIRNGSEDERSPNDTTVSDPSSQADGCITPTETPAPDPPIAEDTDEPYEGLTLLFENVALPSDNMDDCLSDQLSIEYGSKDSITDESTASDSSDDSPSSPTRLTSSDTTIKPRKTRGQAYEAIFIWLRDLFEPIAHIMVDHLRVEEKRLQVLRETEGLRANIHVPQEWVEEDLKARGGKATLHSEDRIMDLPEYTETKVDQLRNNSLWKVVCSVTDIDGNVWTADATRYTKQAAANVAAWKICVQMGILGADVQ